MSLNSSDPPELRGLTSRSTGVPARTSDAYSSNNFEEDPVTMNRRSDEGIIPESMGY
jgi:hypothetical protein